MAPTPGTPILQNLFDMWRDYMNLGSLVQLLGGRWAADPGPDRPSPGPSSSSDGGAESPSSDGGSSPAGSLSERPAPARFCPFCKRNGESSDVYLSHDLRSDRGRVLCPILRSYTCPTCGATGDRAHTRSYCPARRCPQPPQATPLPRFW